MDLRLLRTHGSSGLINTGGHSMQRQFVLKVDSPQAGYVIVEVGAGVNLVLFWALQYTEGSTGIFRTFTVQFTILCSSRTYYSTVVIEHC